MTNYEWLLQMDGADRKAWFDAEHVENQERALDGDTAAQNADSREQLEADARKIADAYNMDSRRHGTERFAHELYYSIIHLLDRQRALSYEVCDECSKEYYELQDEVNELQAKVDRLTAERDELEVRADYNSHGWAKANIGWAEANAETEKWRMKCDEYREKFGKCLDYADAIHALMDDEGMA